MGSWISWGVHLDDEQLILYIDRELKFRSRLRTGIHLLFCPLCRNARLEILLRFEEVVPAASTSADTLLRMKLGLVRAMRAYESRAVQLTANAASQVSQIAGGVLATRLSNHVQKSEDSSGAYASIEKSIEAFLGRRTARGLRVALLKEVPR